MNDLALASFLLLVAPLGAFATPEATSGRGPRGPGENGGSWGRKSVAGGSNGTGKVAIPPPCKPVTPAPNSRETEKRFQDFASDLIVKKDVYAAFGYVSANYDNHSPGVRDGQDAAVTNLDLMISKIAFSNQKSAFKDNMGWLSYDASGSGHIVDRFRIESGCIVEHWDQGQTFPDCSSVSCQNL